MVHIVFSRKATDARTRFAIKDVHVSIPDIRLVVRDLPLSRPILLNPTVQNPHKHDLNRSMATSSNSISRLFVRARGKSVLRRTFKPIAVAIVKRKMKNALEEGIRDSITRLVGTVFDWTSPESPDEKRERENNRDERSLKSGSTTTLDRLRHSGGGGEGDVDIHERDNMEQKKVRIVFRKEDVKMRWANWGGGWVHRIRELMEGPFHSAYGTNKGEDKWRSNAYVPGCLGVLIVGWLSLTSTLSGSPSRTGEAA